jgi:uncharacterized protein
VNPLERRPPDLPLPDGSLGSLIHELSQMRTQAIHNTTRRFCLSPTQWRVLSKLSHCNGAFQSRLASQLRVAKGNLGAVLMALQRSGWVRRRRVPQDSRIKRVFLTQKAWDAMSMVDEETSRFSQTMLNGLQPEQQFKLIQALEKVQQNIAVLSIDKERRVDNAAGAAPEDEGLPPEFAESMLPGDSHIEQRLSVLTLGVADVPRSRRFYEQALGWTTSPASSEAVVFFELGGITLALFERSLLAQDAGLPVGRGVDGFGGIALTHVVRSRQEVDLVLRRVASKHGRIIRAAADVFWGGYSGYFADPDGHAWEIASTSSNIQLRPDGRVQLPMTEAFNSEGLCEGVL